MAKNKHINLDDRSTIAVMLKEKETFASIGKAIGKDPTTISKEIRSHLIFKHIGGHCISYNSCVHRFTCQKSSVCNICHSERKYKLCRRCSLCNRFCSEFEKEICKKLLKPPYVCNGCSKHRSCSLEKRFYDPMAAQDEYLKVLSETRSGIALSEEEVRYLDEIVSPLIKKQQSPHHICVHNKDSLMVSEHTIYRLIDARLVSAMNIDLPRKVRFSARKKTTVLKIDRKCRIGRDHNAFRTFMEEYPDLPVVQLDSLEGTRGGKVLLTIHFVKAEMMLAFLRDHNDSQSVIDIFDFLYEVLGADRFKKLFPVCLTDNGSEFSNPSALEKDAKGQFRTRIFYCDPSAPYQKGSAERNHEFIRCFIPKGTDLGLYTQLDISLMMDHINSYGRKSLGDKSPYEMFAFLYGKEVLELLDCHTIHYNDVTLNSSVFCKEVTADEI